MNLSVQKRLCAQLLHCGESRVIFNVEHLTDIKEAITKFDLRTLIKKGYIHRAPLVNTSRGHARIIHLQKQKGRRRGHGSHKGLASARTNTKDAWMARIRLQRKLLVHLKNKNKLSPKDFRTICQKAKGGFFRSKRHIKLYLEENKFLRP
ncbi:MAG: 50S ribosomal protein L19e [Nanoarchaeota archaeon]